MEFVTFNVIIDDLVFPDGQTQMGVLGGGGPQAAFGMRLWSDEVGLSARVGDDLPAEVPAWLDACGIDRGGLRFNELPTPRAWQALEADGRRTQVWRVPGPVIGAQLARRVVDLPPDYRRAIGYHVGVHPLDFDTGFIADLRLMSQAVMIEPFKPAERRPAKDELCRLVCAGSIFSPNREEAVSLVGEGAPPALLGRLLRAGAHRVALRLGDAGSLVAARSQRRAACIPAVPVRVVDPVGAGNAYCGGFLAGWALTGDLIEAGLYGAVSASFLVEQVGCPPRVDEAVLAEARRRLELLRREVCFVDLE